MFKLGFDREMDRQGIREIFSKNFFADHSVCDQFLYFFASKELHDKGTYHKILCLHGVPGAGKRTMLRELCRALGWELVTVKLGEVTSGDGQVVGSFRTDLNAIAARVVHALDGLAGENVALLLEDLDKINPPAMHNANINFFSVVEQMQQYAVQNNYKQDQIDLGTVTFMATAKNLATVPSGLHEQLQVVTLPAYSESDKLKIVKKYILPQLTETYRLEGRCQFSENAIKKLIREYSREGGVRQVKADLETICKKIVLRLSDKNEGRLERVFSNHIAKLMGPPRYPLYKDQDKDKIGVISLLGKSDKGGCTLLMESLVLLGDGKVLITGNTDRLFEESANVAVSYLRSNAKSIGIKEDFFRRFDMHLHMQYGQVPKYGVSAGTGIVTVLVSALSGKPVRGNIGVTGEVSLHGRILGVNDIRDKVLGACQAGLTDIFLPLENTREARNLSVDIQRSINIFMVDDVQDLLTKAIVW